MRLLQLILPFLIIHSLSAQENEKNKITNPHRVRINYGVSVPMGQFGNTGNWQKHGGTADIGHYSSFSFQHQFAKHFSATFFFSNTVNSLDQKKFGDLLTSWHSDMQLLTTEAKDPYRGTFALVGIKGIFPVKERFKFYFNPMIGQGSLTSPEIRMERLTFFTYVIRMRSVNQTTLIYSASTGVDFKLFPNVFINLDANYLASKKGIGRYIKTSFRSLNQDEADIQNIQYSTLNLSLGLSINFN
jgi:hypothetical protein